MTTQHVWYTTGSGQNVCALMKHLPSVFILLALPVSVNWAQSQPDWGHPFVKHYTRSDHHGDAPNWSVVQDQRGLIYAGNSWGVLEYDGATWRLIEVPEGLSTVVRDLYVDSQNTVFVGAEGAFGYLTPNAIGSLYFQSLVDRVPAHQRAFRDIWRVCGTSMDIYFQADAYLFRWDGTRIHTTEGHFRHLYCVQDEVYVQPVGEPLMHLRDGTLDALDGITDTEDVVGMWTAPPHGLVVAKPTGLFRYASGELTRLPTERDALFNDAPLQAAVQLSSGRYALTTQADAVVVLTPEGNHLYTLDKDSGLALQPVRHVMEDKQGNLWVAQHGTLVRAEVESPGRYFDLALQDGVANEVLRHQGELFIGTTQGVFRQSRSNENGLPHFEPAFNTTQSIGALQSYGEWILGLVLDEGLIGIQAGVAQTILPTARTYRVAESDSTLFFVGDDDGFFRLRYDPVSHRWGARERVGGITDKVWSFVESPEGTFWLGHQPSGVTRVVFEAGYTSSATVERLDPENELEADIFNIFAHQGRVGFLSNHGVLRYAPDKDPPFVSDEAWGAPFTSQDNPALRMIEGPNNYIFAFMRQGIWRSRRGTDGSYTWDGHLLPSTLNYPPLLVEEDNTQTVLWSANGTTLMRYALNDIPPSSALTVLIRRFAVGNEARFGGSDIVVVPPVLSHQENNVALAYAAPHFMDETRTQYAVWLDGLEADWSPWTSETTQHYPRLPTGTYTFRVRARNSIGIISPEARFAFTVRPPWYLTPWAIVLWSVLGLGFAVGLGLSMQAYRTRRIAERNRTLEALVEDRTTEVVQQKEQLERQAAQLLELDRVKSEFFANISHEFRTPLTLIIGPLKQALAQGTIEPSSLERMLRNSQRLQRLINQILDLAKLESGELRLQAAQHDVVTFARQQTEAFRAVADYRDVALQFHSSAAVVPLYFDVILLEHVLTNLLSNAVKFTPSGGHIAVHITETPADVSLTVYDSGIGLAPDQQARVFDRFYQVDATSTRAHEGTGIGLALTKELVELHGGTISLESQLGEGAAFCVQLPKGRAHLKEKQIAPDVQTTSPEQPSTDWDEASVAQQPAALSDPLKDKLLIDDVTTLLVVEDNADMRAYIRSIFASNYRIREAEDGLEGLVLARDLLPDLIISDVMMPHMDGLTMVQELAKETATASIPIVLLTARAAAEDELAGLAAGAVDYVRKPFDAPVLQARVRSLLHLRHRLRERYTALEDELLVPAPKPPSPTPLSFTDQVKQIIEDRLADEHLSVDHLAAATGVSRTMLFQKLNDEGALPPSQMVRQLRLERAAQWLRTKEGSISEVAYGVGFSSLSYFSRCFKAEFGVSPSAYLEEPSHHYGGRQP